MLLIFMLITTNIIFAKEKTKGEISSCYGLSIPLPHGKDTAIETFQDTEVRNYINDLLREKIDVFWISEDINILSAQFKDGSIIDTKEFYKGSFIVPFTDNVYKNNIIIVISTDYNYSSEIKDEGAIQTEIYRIMQPLEFRAYKLKEVKIAQHLGDSVRYSWPCYLQIADACGFFTFEFLIDFETSEFLNNEDFNVFMWPYKPNPASSVEIFKTLSDRKGINSIRQFVKNGGGYVGSCYGAAVAASGSLWPLPLFFIRRAYNVNLKSVPFSSFAIADNWMRPFLDRENMYITVSSFTDKNHPLSYGLNDTVIDFFNGAMFKWIGKKSNAISYHTDVMTKDGESDVDEGLKKDLLNTPSRVATTFGDGKIVQFACHPEYVINIPILFNNIEWKGDPYYGRRTISNALYYANSEENNTNYITTPFNNLQIDIIINNTKNISFQSDASDEFEIIIDKIETIREKINELDEKITILKSEFSSFDEKYESLGGDNRHLRYIQFYDEIYIDYLNRSIKSIEILKSILPLYLVFNESYRNIVDDMKTDIEKRTQNADNYITEIIGMNDYLFNILIKDNYNIIELFHLTKDRRKMINQYEIVLKYIPQIYFNAIKISRTCWYNLQLDLITIK